MMEPWRPKRLTPGKPRPSPLPSPRVAKPEPPPAGPAAPVAIQALGPPPWTSGAIEDSLEPFLEVYARRPVEVNEGGMRSTDLLALWYLLRGIRPELVLESGVNKGLTTWLIEDTLDPVRIFCFDADPGRREYASAKASYSTADFLDADGEAWAPEPGRAFAVFDDHRDVLPRIRRCRDQGIGELFFGSNYPGLSGGRHRSVAACLNGEDAAAAEELKGMIATYAVFPPVFDHAEPITLERTPIGVPSLLGPYDPARHGALRIFREEMPWYRWPSLVRLK